MKLDVTLTGARIVSVSNPVHDMIPGSVEDFKHIVKQHLEPSVASARRELDRGIDQASAKLKAWALEHLTMAQKLGKRTDTFSKIVNSPKKTTRQLALNMLAGSDGAAILKAPMAKVEKEAKEKEEEKELDDLLGSIGL